MRTPAISETTQTIPQLSDELDYYKLTMSQLAYHKEPNAIVTSTYHNRGSQRIMDYVNPQELQERLNEIGRQGWRESELRFLGSLVLGRTEPVFSGAYLRDICSTGLPNIVVRHDQEIDDIAIETTGAWPLQTFWETTVMAELSEAYFANYLAAHGSNSQALRNEGDRRLSEKIATLRSHPELQIAEFGTRRRFSRDWHEHVVERLVAECPDNLVGTSNVGMAGRFGLRPIGTFAHEMPMVYAALADARGQDIRASHRRFFEDWHDEYGEDLSIALTDTFTTDFFFEDFTASKAREWKGIRQDSGNAAQFGEKMIAFYTRNGIDPRNKLIVFSDNLDMRRVQSLNKQFEGRIGTLYGIGTNLTHDLGITALNQVMKATHVRVADTEHAAYCVKLSDDAGKYTGPAAYIRKYQEIFTGKL